MADGRLALDLEDAVLRWWHELGAAPCLRDDVPDGDCDTECVHLGRVDAPGTVAFVEELVAGRVRQGEPVTGSPRDPPR